MLLKILNLAEISLTVYSSVKKMKHILEPNLMQIDDIKKQTGIKKKK